MRTFGAHKSLLLAHPVQNSCDQGKLKQGGGASVIPEKKKRGFLGEQTKQSKWTDGGGDPIGEEVQDVKRVRLGRRSEGLGSVKKRNRGEEGAG